MTDFSGVADADPLAPVIASLKAYPDISESELRDLRQWFHKRASAYDVAMLSSNPQISRGYTRFRAEHIDRFTALDLLRAVAFVGVVVTMIWLVLHRAG